MQDLSKTMRHNSFHQTKHNSHNHAHSLTQLKKTTQNFPLLQHELREPPKLVSKPLGESLTLRQTKSRGKLRTGSINKPTLILSKEQRKNPFFK